MKIEWTDAACDTVSKLAWDAVTPIRRETARNILNLATAEQFRPETPEEKCKRLEAALQEIRDGWTNTSAGAQCMRLTAKDALAGPNGSKESGT